MTEFPFPLSNNLSACPDCDLLLQQLDLAAGDKAHCPRCGYLLQNYRKQGIEHTLALSIAGLILTVPTNLMPLVGITMMGNTKDGTLWSGVAMLFTEDHWALALLVFLSSMLFPFLTIILSLLISAHLFFNKPSRYLVRWMQWLLHIEEWAMLEVYLLGIIVACVKLSANADLRFGFGLYAFVGLLVITVMLSANMDRQQFWSRIRQYDL